jgi:hypothetical protein
MGLQTKTQSRQSRSDAVNGGLVSVAYQVNKCQGYISRVHLNWGLKSRSAIPSHDGGGSATRLHVFKPLA